NAGTNPIVNPNAYPIVGTSETIWVRIEDETGTCYAIDSFVINFTPVRAETPSPYALCDFDNSGSQSIDLYDVFATVILDGQSAQRFTLTFHDDPGDANTGNNPLPQPYVVTSSPVTIYARVQNNDNPDCFETTSFQIFLNTPPEVNPDPLPLIICDTGNDGYGLFNLHDADEDITMGDASLTVTYHPTYLDAENDLNELLDPYTNDDPWNDVVFARVVGDTPGCYSIVVLSLEVRLSPVVSEPSALRACAGPNGTAVFDLTSREDEILFGLDGSLYDVYYYEEESDAILAGNLALTDPDFSAAIGNPLSYTNLTNPQTIYVLVVG